MANSRAGLKLDGANAQISESTVEQGRLPQVKPDDKSSHRQQSETDSATSSESGEVDNDSNLVLSFQHGDMNAFVHIYARYHKSLIATASNMVASQSDVADVVHDVFIIAIQRLHQLENPAALLPWLFKILRREVYRRSRNRRIAVSLSIVEANFNHLVAPHDPRNEAADVIADETAFIVRQSVAGLDHRDQSLFAAATRHQLHGSETLVSDHITHGELSDSASRMMILRMRERLLASRSAYLVARYGQCTCPHVRQLLRDWNGVFSPLIRKRISRHIDTCARCQETRLRFSSVTLITLILACGAVSDLPPSDSETPNRSLIPAIQPHRDPAIPR